MRSLIRGKNSWYYLPAFLLIVFGVLSQRGAFILLTPVVINVAFFLAFWFTLVSGTPLVQTFAEAFLRRHDAGQLSEMEVHYCRRVTQAWCLFFILNTGAALWTVWYGSAAMWTLYNCCISYIFIALFFVVEYLYRTYRFRRYIGFPGEGILQKVFPPRVLEL